MKKSTLMIILVLAILAFCLPGCGKEDPGTTTAATTTVPTSTTTTAGAPGPEEAPVSHQHHGLHFKLNDSFTAGPTGDNPNVFTFSNEKISGSITFGSLPELVGDMVTSKNYAQSLIAKYGADNAKMGTSTNIAFYVVHQHESGITVESLYTYGQDGWLVTATSTDVALKDQLVKIVGPCGINPEEIPA